MSRPTPTPTIKKATRIVTSRSKIAVDLPKEEPRSCDTEGVGSADIRLVGGIKIVEVTENQGARVFVMTVDGRRAGSVHPDTIGPVSLEASRAEYYQTMISAFAKAVVSELEK